MTVVWAAPGVQDVVPVRLPSGATVARSRLVEHYGLDAARLRFAVFGKRAAADAGRGDGDRVEITRALVADPKESRRRRALAQPLAKSAPKGGRRGGR